MPTSNNKFEMPRDKTKLERIVNIKKNCDTVISSTIDGKQGPIIKETLKCPCGNINIVQQSVITDVENPERSTELVQIESKECEI